MKMHYFTQNFNEDEHHRPKGSAFWHGRAWLMFKRVEWHVEWLFGKRASMCHIHFDIGAGDSHNGLLLAVSIPRLFGIYLGVTGVLPEKWRPKRWSTYLKDYLDCRREIGLSWHDGTLWVSLWEDPMESHRSDPWWWQFNFNPADFFLGNSNYSTRDLSTERVDVAMPERVYPCTVRIFESTWKRPRWHWPRKMIRADIVPDTPIPFPGKGENSWDCGDDATWSMTCPAQTPAEAARMLRDFVMRERVKYGGSHWIPATAEF